MAGEGRRCGKVSQSRSKGWGLVTKNLNIIERSEFNDFHRRNKGQRPTLTLSQPNSLKIDLGIPYKSRRLDIHGG